MNELKKDYVGDQACRFGTQPAGGAMLIWEITNVCNLECLHCCTTSGPLVSATNEVDDESVFRAIDDFRSVSVKEVMFSGGEPFLRISLMGFIERAVDSGADVYIASNGTLITKKIAQDLADYSIKRLDISLDGDVSKIHQEVRLHPAAFDRTIRGIVACVEQNVPLRVSTVVTPNNYSRVEKLIGVLINLGVTSVVVNCVQGASGRAAENPHLSIESVPEDSIRRVLEQAIDKYGKLIRIDCRLFQEYSSAPTGCPAGKSVLHIAPNGDVSPCSWLYKLDRERFTLGNIKTDSFAECVGHSGSLLQPLVRQTSGCVIPYVNSR